VFNLEARIIILIFWRMSSDIQKKFDKKPCLSGFGAQAGDITGKRV
jgi:hypothetical protein